jgi:hypothetical protein
MSTSSFWRSSVSVALALLFIGGTSGCTSLTRSEEIRVRKDAPPTEAEPEPTPAANTDVQVLPSRADGPTGPMKRAVRNVRNRDSGPRPPKKRGGG